MMPGIVCRSQIETWSTIFIALMWDCIQEYIFYKCPNISHNVHGLCEASKTNTILGRGYENSTPKFQSAICILSLASLAESSVRYYFQK